MAVMDTGIYWKTWCPKWKTEGSVEIPSTPSLLKTHESGSHLFRYNNEDFE